MSSTKSTSTHTTSTHTARPGTATATGKKTKAEAKAEATAATPDTSTVKVNSKPWEDLPANPALQKTPREKTTLAVILHMTSQPEGATLAECKAAFGTMIKADMVSHDPKAVMTFMSRNRGWGFRMDKDTGKVHLVATPKAHK